VLAVALAIAASVAAGRAAERRFGEGARAASRAMLTALLWTVLPFVTFFTLARLEIDAGVGAGLLFAYAELALVGALAYLLATRVLGLDRPATGALVVVVVLANTGYLGIPLTAALLGPDDLAAAIAFDTVVSGPMFYVVGFAIGAAFGTAAGATRRARARAFVTRNPPLVAVVAALLAPDALAPDALVDVARVVVYAILPVGFFALGVTLAAESAGARPALPALRRRAAGPTSPSSRRLVAAVAVALALRLLVAPAALLGMSALIVRVPDAYLVQAAMPSGINSLIVAHAYGLDLRLISTVLAWSTGIAVVAAVAVALL
jgi:malate permease and related proteins